MKERGLNFHSNDDKTIVAANLETQEKAVSKYHEIKNLLGMVITRYQEGKLEEGFKETCLQCSEHYLKELCDIFGYSGEIKEKQEQRHKEIKQLNTDNRELRRQLGEKVSNEDLREKMKNVSKAIRKWWNIEGFGHMSEDCFVTSGYFKAKLSGMICSDYYSDSETRGTDQNKVDKLRAMGYEISTDDGRQVADTEANRQLLHDQIKAKFPSADIVSFYSYWARGKEKAEIRDVEFYIYDLNDVITEKTEADE